MDPGMFPGYSLFSRHPQTVLPFSSLQSSIQSRFTHRFGFYNHLVSLIQNNPPSSYFSYLYDRNNMEHRGQFACGMSNVLNLWDTFLPRVLCCSLCPRACPQAGCLNVCGLRIGQGQLWLVGQVVPLAAMICLTTCGDCSPHLCQGILFFHLFQLSSLYSHIWIVCIGLVSQTDFCPRLLPESVIAWQIVSW